MCTISGALFACTEVTINTLFPGYKNTLTSTMCYPLLHADAIPRSRTESGQNWICLSGQSRGWRPWRPDSRCGSWLHSAHCLLCPACTCTRSAVEVGPSEESQEKVKVLTSLTHLNHPKKGVFLIKSATFYKD